jgi:hypothetical protein
MQTISFSVLNFRLGRLREIGLASSDSLFVGHCCRWQLKATLTAMNSQAVVDETAGLKTNSVCFHKFSSITSELCCPYSIDRKKF